VANTTRPLTLLAPPQGKEQPAAPALLGLMQRSFACLLEQSRSRGSDLALSASYVEIYNEQVSARPAAQPGPTGTPCLRSPGASPPPYPPGPGSAEPRATTLSAPAMEQNPWLLRGEPAQRGLREPGGHH